MTDKPEFPPDAKSEVTQLLLAWSDGDAAALGRLMPLVFDELRGMAHHYLEGEDPRHTLQPTALVNEVYLRLVDRRKVQWRNRAHFFGFAAQLMRRVLVDYARCRQTFKRGTGRRPISIEVLRDLPEPRDLEVLLVDEALIALAREDERQAKLVELRFFAGLTNEEIAEILGISVTTVKRDWNTARVWLYRELSQGWLPIVNPRGHWPEVKALLEQVLEAPTSERADLLSRLCPSPEQKAEVEELIALEEQMGSFIDEPVFSLLRSASEAAEGERLGAWRLLRPLGKGGMGTVYLAERADGAFELTAAVKILKVGLETEEVVARFETERRLLARLIHPNIARLLDGGTRADGRPYFVMEYVEGEPIDRYCDRRDLSIRERLDLFRAVCSAVQLAHQNLVVHRDLKPANVLVTEDGTVKLLDFGIAKLLASSSDDPRTLLGLGLAPFTPRYASPEQVRGEAVTTASDVYSLGVLLYELLTGQLPYRIDTQSPTEVERIVCSAVPPRPSVAVRGAEVPPAAGGEGDAPRAKRDLKAQARRLVGDLDTIVLRALRKEPERRFATAEQLSEDLRLYLEDLPIRSRPDSLRYRAGKFLTRHWVPVAAGAVVLVLLVGFAAVMTWQRAEIAARSLEVTRERDRAEATKDFLLQLIGQTDPRLAKGQEVTIRQALDQKAGRLVEERDLDPATRADLLDAVGVSYRALGRYDEAGPFLEEALALRRRALGAEHILVAESLHNLAGLERNRKNPAAAERLMREALMIQRKAYPEGHRDLARGLNNFASLLRDKASTSPKTKEVLLAEAEKFAREGLAMKQRLFGAENVEVALSLNTLAAILVNQNRSAEAEALFRQSIALRRTLDGPISPGLAQAMQNLAVLLEEENRLAEAEVLRRESLAMRRRLYPDGHADLVRSLEELGQLRERRGDKAEAAMLLVEAEGFRKILTAEP